jgi:hypothetical protein
MKMMNKYKKVKYLMNHQEIDTKNSNGRKLISKLLCQNMTQ